MTRTKDGRAYIIRHSPAERRKAIAYARKHQSLLAPQLSIEDRHWIEDGIYRDELECIASKLVRQSAFTPELYELVFGEKPPKWVYEQEAKYADLSPAWAN